MTVHDGHVEIKHEEMRLDGVGGEEGTQDVLAVLAVGHLDVTDSFKRSFSEQTIIGIVVCEQKASGGSHAASWQGLHE